jgi:hypothetical protein
MKTLRFSPSVAAALTFLSVGSAAVAEGLPITPGLWEMTSQNPMTGEDDVLEECMSDGVFDPISMMEETQGCTFSNETVSGNSIDYDMTCTDPEMPGAMTAQFSFTIDGDQGSGNVDMRMEMNGQTAMSMSTSVTARRVGDC